MMTQQEPGLTDDPSLIHTNHPHIAMSGKVDNAAAAAADDDDDEQC